MVLHEMRFCMTVYYQLKNRKSIGADRFIADAWCSGWDALGYNTQLFTDVTEIRPVSGDLLMVDAILLDDSGYNAIDNFARNGIHVFVWSNNVLDGRWLDRLKSCPGSVHCYGELEPDVMEEFQAYVGKPYYTIANSANPQKHFVVERDAEYECDIVFIGSKLPKKKWFNDLVLKHLAKQYDVRLYGPNWDTMTTVRYFFSRAERKLIKRNIFVSDPLQLPLEKENVAYRSARICLNFHELYVGNTHNIVNQRTFKIAACGGFQICDEVPALRKYYSEDEVVGLPYDYTLWLDTVDYYLSNPEKRNTMADRAAERSAKDHMSVNRARKILSILRAPR